MFPKPTSPESEPPPEASWWKKLLRYAAYALVVAVLGAAAWGLLWYWPRQAGEALPLLEDPTGELTLQDKLRRQVEVRQLEKDRVATGAQVFLGLGILVGIYLTWRRIRATEQQAESSLKQAEIANRQAQTAQAQAELARRQQTAERFTKAIEQLGSDEISIRLGGIYALEKIAQDEPVEYFNQFREVLCAFVRETAREPHVNEGGERTPLSTDLQVVLTVLGRNPSSGGGNDPARIDWSGAHLEGANLHGAHLESANLDGVHLEGANLNEAHLEGAALDGAHLEDAALMNAHLIGAVLYEAHVKDANFHEAHLEGASLLSAHLGGAFFDDAHLEGTDLRAPHLERAELEDARYNHHTKFPKDFTPPESMIYVDYDEEGSGY